MTTDPAIETTIWRPDPERLGISLVDRVRTVREVYDDLRAAVGEYPKGAEEYLSLMPQWLDDEPWPQGRIVVFAVNGSSEGDYVHVEVHDREGSRVLLILGKTFDGRDAAWAFARQAADLLGA